MNYPNLEAYDENSEAIDAILEFVDYFNLSAMAGSIQTFGDGRESIPDWSRQGIYTYIKDIYDVDMNEVERERTEMLKAIRENS